MLCSKPVRLKEEVVGCGQCLACRINKRRIWTSRLQLEWNKHAVSWWITLTYAPENLPSDGSVSVRDAQLYLKRLRKAASPAKLRYFIVGEYGDETQRPHYHAAVFGNVAPEVIEASWTLGHVQVRPITIERLQYLAGYTVKKWTRVSSYNEKALGSRAPEFARMSLRPGIGRDAVEDFARAHHSRGGSVVVSRTGDVMGSYRSAGRMWPLGRYLKSELRKEVIGNDGKEEAYARDLRRAHARAESGAMLDFGAAVRRKRLNKVERLAAREKIFKKGRML